MHLQSAVDHLANSGMSKLLFDSTVEFSSIKSLISHHNRHEVKQNNGLIPKKVNRGYLVMFRLCLVTFPLPTYALSKCKLMAVLKV